MTITARAEHVGSLLRPPALREAREAHVAGELDARTFKRVEDDAVRAVVAAQERLGFPVITDGEFRPRVVPGSADPGRGRLRGRGHRRLAARSVALR